MDELLVSMKASDAIPGAKDLKNMLSGQHFWHSVFNARPTFCNICRESVNRNVISHGVTCEVCKFKVHKRCVEKTINNCKWTTLASVGKDIIEDDHGNIIMPHQWLEGNIPLYTKCAVCGKNCGSIRRLQDWKCIWCRVSVHTACRPKLSVMCPLGPNHVSVVPPTAIHSIGIDDAWDAVKPQGCLPLLVFVNSKSGDNQGVKFLRRFRQLLNPAQVFDLMSCGPTLGLRLFRRFHPFRVLVCSGDGSVGWVLSEVDRLNMQLQCQVGVLPLGTGNDLARVLGWGAACDDDTHLPQLLEKYERAGTKVLDRWSIMVFERSIKVGDVPKVTSSSTLMNENELFTTAAEYEDSVLSHLSKIFQSDQHSTVISSAKVLCETVKDFLSKISHVTLMQGDDDFSEKCQLLKTKLDHLLKVLSEEQLQAYTLDFKETNLLKQTNEKFNREDQEKSVSSVEDIDSDVQMKSQLHLRANSLKRAVRRVVEHAEKVVDEQNIASSPFLRSPSGKSAESIVVAHLESPPKNQCLSPTSPEFTLNVTSISPLPEVRRDSSCSTDLNLESLPVPREFADSRHGSFAEPSDQRKMSFNPEKRTFIFEDDHISEANVESETSNSYLLKGLFNDSEDEEIDLKSETAEQVKYMMENSPSSEIGRVEEKERRVKSLCGEFAHIGHIDSSETSDDSPENSSNPKNDPLSMKEVGNLNRSSLRESIKESELSYPISIEGVCNLGSELDMTNLFSTSPEEEECSEEYKREMGLDMSKRCSIAHFIEGSDIARKSVKCRHRNRSFDDLDKDCVAVFPVPGNPQDPAYATTLPCQMVTNVPKVDVKMHVPRIHVSSSDDDDGGFRGNLANSQSINNVDSLYSSNPDTKVHRQSCAISETDDEEYCHFGNLEKNECLANSNSTGPTVIIDPPSPASMSPNLARKLVESPMNSPKISGVDDLKGINRHCRRLSAASPLMSVHCSPSSARRVSNISLLTSETSELKDSSNNINERLTIYKRLPIINPLVRLPQWPNVKETGLVGKALLANADALCAAAAPIMDHDEAITEGFFERCVMNNYFGIGIDAKISLDFHQKREEHPEKCRSRTRNYMWYGVLGSKQWLQKTCKNLEQRVQLECDGRRIPLPSLQGIVVLNIPSFMGGINFWGGTKGDDIFLSPSIDDRVLEVVAVFGTVQMAASRLINLQHHRIAQCSNVLIHILGEEGVPIQVDGEAWIQPPGIIRIIHKNKVKMLCRNEALDCTSKEWEEKQRQHRQHNRLNSNAKPTELSEDEIGILLSFIEATTSLIKYVKLLTIRSPSIEADLYQLADAVASNLERVHPGGKLLQGVELRLAVTDLVINAQRLVEETNAVLQDKTLRLATEIEGPLNSSIQQMEIELKKCCFTGANQTSIVYFKILSPDEERKILPGRKSSAGAFWQRFRRNSGISNVRYTRREVALWDVSDVTHWLETIQLSEYAESFSSNDVRGRELLTLTRTDLKELGVTKVGHVKRLLLAIKEFLP